MRAKLGNSGRGQLRQIIAHLGKAPADEAVLPLACLLLAFEPGGNAAARDLLRLAIEMAAIGGTGGVRRGAQKGVEFRVGLGQHGGQKLFAPVEEEIREPLLLSHEQETEFAQRSLGFGEGLLHGRNALLGLLDGAQQGIAILADDG